MPKGLGVSTYDKIKLLIKGFGPWEEASTYDKIEPLLRMRGSATRKV